MNKRLSKEIFDVKQGFSTLTEIMQMQFSKDKKEKNEVQIAFDSAEYKLNDN